MATRLTLLCVGLAACLVMFASTLSGGHATVYVAQSTWGAAGTPASNAASVRPTRSVEAAAEDAGVALASNTGSSGTPAVVQPSVPQLAAVARKPQAALDGSLDAALQSACPAGPGFVMVSFANSALADHLRNFVAHAAAAGTPFLIGAVDRAAFDQLSAQGTTTYLTPLALEGVTLDGSNQHSSRSWKKFAGMRTGEVNNIVQKGYSVLHTDVDVIWLRDPTPFFTCTGPVADREFGPSSRFPCAPMLKADVMVSSDNMSPGRDAEGRASYSAGGTFNTGILFIRANDRGKTFAREWVKNVVTPAAGSRYAPLTSDQQVFNGMMRNPNQWPGISASHGSPTMSGWGGAVTLGALPLVLFMNGHGYFVGSAHKKLNVDPLCVHATYSLDMHDGVAKRQRFREAGLWRAYPEDYFTGRYLALALSEPPQVTAALAQYKKRNEPPSNIDVHGRALRAYVTELRDALALAQALKRTLVLPRWVCYCDRLWSGSDDVFHFGCMYPGSQDGKFVPFNCPMDHVLSPAAWEKSSIAHRDASFLEDARFKAPGAIVDVAIMSRDEFNREPHTQRPALPTGATDGEASRLLASFAQTPVLRLAHARGLLCSLDGGAAAADAFNKKASALLRVPQWCAKCFEPCDKELLKWLPIDQIRNGGGGRNFFCLPEPPIPQFRNGACVRNNETRA